MAHVGRICFIGNNDKTEFYKKLADEIDVSKIRVSWIVVNRKQRDSLLERFPSHDVLFFNLSTPDNGNTFDIKINDLIFSDRCLKSIKARGHKYLRAIQAPIFNFLLSDTPTLVVGELTYGHEVLIHRMVSQLLKSCYWVAPFHTRMLEGKFSFFGDEAFSRENVIAPDDSVDMVEVTEHEASYKEMIRRHADRQGSMRFYAEKFWTFITMKDYDRDEPSWNRNTRSEKLVKNVSHFINKITYRYVRKSGLEELENCEGRTVIFPLHLEPELNIDTCGRYWENQSETILKIWRQLAPNDMLFLKEHPVAIGNRGARWYADLLSYPNIRLLHHNIPVDLILKRVDYVFTISGTMGLEAALEGRKVLCLAPTTYDRLENVVSPSIYDFNRTRNIEDLFNILVEEKVVSWNLAEYYQHVERYAFVGDPEGDLTSDSTSWRPDNVRAVARALDYALRKMGSVSD